MKLLNRVSHRIRSRGRKWPPVRLSFDLFEERLLLTPFTVTSAADPFGLEGTTTLRQAIVDSNATPGPNTIDFNIPGPGVQTISPASPLPPITVPVVINGYTQPGASPNTLANGYNAVLLIELDGANAPATTDGLLINAGGSTVEGLVINQFGGDGVQITGSGATGNMVQGNFIGTNAAGTAALGNGTGVVIDSGASNNTIGGTGAGAGNVISGNSSDGIDIGSFSPPVSSGNGNLVQANKIGTNAAGTAELGNGNPANLGSFGAGVRFIDGMSNTVGGTAAGAGNLISGNVNEGIFFLGNDGASDEMVLGNLVGTNAAGTAPIGNGLSGITLLQSAANTIGGNVISGNGVGPFGGNGITLAGASNNAVLGNFIGTNAAGTAALGNNGTGVLIDNGATNNTIGGTGAGAGNVISGNSSDGIDISSDGNLVQDNFIGTDVTGTQALGNHFDGIFVSNSSSNTIGGTTTAAARNVSSGNQRFGIWIFGALSTGNLVQGNFIGTDLTGTANLRNSDDGVLIQQGPVGNTIGGTTTAARNVISGNGGFGVSIGLATSNVVQGNFIGTDVTGAKALGNSRGGVIIQDAASNTIGGAAASARNIISGNTGNGITIDGSTATANLLQGNFIGTDVTGTLARGNSGNGVQISSGATNNTIGGTVGGAGNLIGANNANGIYITGSGTSANPVLGNYIGTNASGANLGNGAGVAIDNSASNNTIGGTGAGAGNVISSNSGDGIDISSDGNFVQGNKIGTDVMGSSSLGNQGAGVSISGSNNTIGGTESGAGNVISGNKDYGISVTGGNNSLLNNLIGTNAAGTAALGNGLSGITLQQSAANTIGGNVISGNGVGPSGGNGISLAGASNNAVLGNYIGVGADGTTPLGNVLDGISLNNASSNSIMDNVVSDNGINQDAAGINLESNDLNNII